MRLVKSLIYLYLIVGLGLGIARFGWGALIAAMAEPEDTAFVAGLMQAAVEGAIRVVMWAPSFYLEVIAGGADVFDWIFYN